MPIRPENKDRYPADWKQIRAAILERAGDKCEGCGLPNHRWLARHVWREHVWQWTDGPREAVGEWKAAVQIVLTIAHLDHVPEHNDPANLRAWCQQCHNAYDAPMRAAGIRERRATAAGQTLLEFAPAPAEPLP